MTKTLAILLRIYRQLLRDHRYLALSILAPLVVVVFLKITLDGMSPGGTSTNSPIVIPIISALVFFFSYLLCSIALVEERTSETLSRMSVSGFGKVEIICGYMIGFATLATVQTLLAFVEAYFVFGLSYSQELVLSLLLIIWLLAVISIALGILVSNFARNQSQVLPFIPLVMLPSVFLSGILTKTIDKLPDWAQVISLVVPLRYSNEIIQNLLRGDSLSSNWTDMLILVGIGVLILSLAVISLRERS